jgi:hypothetical protein
MTPLPRAVATGVQKAPRHEVAGSLALAVGGRYGDLMAAPNWRVDVTPTGCGRQMSALARLEAYNRHLGKRLERINERPVRRGQ